MTKDANWGDEDRIRDILRNTETSSSVEDVGIGNYEYWGARGYDSHLTLCVEGQCVIRFPVTPPDPDDGDPTPTISVEVVEGGCDGDHYGRCDSRCKEFRTDVEWKAVSQEQREDGIYVLYEVQ